MPKLVHYDLEDDDNVGPDTKHPLVDESVLGPFVINNEEREEFVNERERAP